MTEFDPLTIPEVISHNAPPAPAAPPPEPGPRPEDYSPYPRDLPDYPSPFDRDGYIVMLVEGATPMHSGAFVVTREFDSTGIGAFATPEEVDHAIAADRERGISTRLVWGAPGPHPNPPQIGGPHPVSPDLVAPAPNPPVDPTAW